jgi:hypothetical protein
MDELKTYKAGGYRIVNRFYPFPWKVKGQWVWGGTLIKQELQVTLYKKGIRNFATPGPQYSRKWVTVQVIQ